MKKVSKVFPQSGRAPSARSSKRSLARDEGGAVAVMLALMLTVLGGVVALSFDLGRMWNLSTELQTAVDAGALAGATQLNGDDGVRLLAAQAAASEMARNQQIYASIDGAGDVTYSTVFSCTDPTDCVMTNANFRFLVTIDPDVDATSDADARFIEVTAVRTVGFSFAALVGAVNQASPIAKAVAGWEVYVCGNMSLMMCNPAEDPSNTNLTAPFDLDGSDGGRDYRGTGITLKEKGGAGQLIPGEFVWLAIVTCGDDESDPNNCTVEKGANELGEALAQVNPPEACTGNSVVLQTGTITDVGRMVNMRMDIYPNSGPGDYPNEMNYRPSRNPLTGLARDPVSDLTACNFNPVGSGGALKKMDQLGMSEYLGELQSDGITPMHDSIEGPPGTYTFDPPIDHMGYPRDRCTYVDELGNPVVDVDDVDNHVSGYNDHCIFAPPPASGITAGLQVGSGWWDFETYWDYHHPTYDHPADSFDCAAAGCDLGPTGDTVDVDNPANGYGDGNGRISRWEVYQYEMTDYPDNLPIFQDYLYDDMCSSIDPVTAPIPSPDRRMIGIAVGNCNAIIEAGAGIGKNKNKPLPLAGGDSAVNIFLTEAIGELTDNAWYGELVSGLSAGGNDLTSVNIHERIVLHR